MAFKNKIIYTAAPNGFFPFGAAVFVYCVIDNALAVLYYNVKIKKESDMKKYSCFDSPLKIFGLPFFEENKKLERLPEEIRKKLPSLEFFGKRCFGARLCFRTNTKKLRLTAELETLSYDIGMSIYACQSFIVTVGSRPLPKFIGRLRPHDYSEKSLEEEFTLSGEMQDITVWFPRNETVKTVSVEIDNDAFIEAPTPYTHPPMLFYGSSITEGGHAEKPCCAYTSLLSNWLDADFYSMGFSGSAHGEPEMAEFLSKIPMSVFILDYDHNSTVEELDVRHENFFKIIRAENPDLPIVMLNRPLFEERGDYDERRKIIKRTYRNAVSNGDKNVFFIDSEGFFPTDLRQQCTTDDIHPNDFGFYLMAKNIYPTLSTILNT